MKLFDVYPLFDIEIKSGKGCYTYDTEGNEYLDLYGGHAVISIGHSHPYYINKILHFTPTRSKTVSNSNWPIN